MAQNTAAENKNRPKMHPAPEEIDNYFLWPAEKEIYNRLYNQLPADYHVFCTVKWFDFDEEKNKRLESDCDFLIMHPSMGFIALEVKGGYSYKIDGGKWLLQDAYGDTIYAKENDYSPYVQAEASMRHFYNRFKEEYPDTFKGVYGFAVALPNFENEISLAENAKDDFTLYARDMDSLAERINEIFRYWSDNRKFSGTLPEDDWNRLLKMVNKRVALSAAAGALISVKEKEFAKINFAQNQALSMLHNYPRVKIVGGAGTGKTFMGIKKAMADSLSKSTLFVCKSAELARFVKSMLNGTDADVFTYAELMLKELGEGIYNGLPVDKDGIKICYAALTSMPEGSLKKYGSIIVDEAQDFNADMGFSLRELLSEGEDSSFYVFYDECQNIYGNNVNDVFCIETTPYLLRYNVRNTGSIYDYAVEKSGLGADTESNTITGAAPKYIESGKALKSIDQLGIILNRLVNKEGVKTRDITILSDVPLGMSVLRGKNNISGFVLYPEGEPNPNNNEVRFRTVEEFKGLESNVVIYLSHRFTDIDAAEPQKIKMNNYIAITRARYYLYVIHTRFKAVFGADGEGD